jgi:hypothetical protein
MDGLFLLSNLVMLSHFQSLSSLSVRISLERGLPPAHNYRLELPSPERLRLQIALAFHRQVDTPILMICRNLKFLDLRYTLELDPGNLQGELETWMEFDEVDALKQLEIDLEIHVVTEVGSIHPLVDEWLQGLKHQLRRLEQGDQLEQLEQQQYEPGLEREWQWQRPEREQQQRQRERRLGRQRLRLRLEMEQRRLEREEQRPLGEREEQMKVQQQQRVQWERVLLREREELEWEQKQRQQHPQHLRQGEQYLLFMLSMQTRWRQWLNLPDYLEHVQQGSLKVTLSTQMHEKACGLSRDTVEEILMMGLPQLTELATFKILLIFPEHLQELRLHGFSMPDSLPSIDLPNLVSLEVDANGLDDLLILRNIKVPRLRDLRVQVQDVPGEIHKYDWRDTTCNPLNHISLQIKIPRHQRGNCVVIFQLPQNTPLHLWLADSAPLSYTLHANLGAMSCPMDTPSRIETISVNWREDLITEWINPHYGLPSLTEFGAMVSLRRAVLDQKPYLLSKQSPTDVLSKLLAENIHICPHLTSITVSQCPSSWPSFLCQLRRRNGEAMLSKSTKCIEELSFYQPLHATIIQSTMDSMQAKILNDMGLPRTRQGNGWPMRPFREMKTVLYSSSRDIPVSEDG